jgi:hypothetical protein
MRVAAVLPRRDGGAGEVKQKWLNRAGKMPGGLFDEEHRKQGPQHE